MNVSEVAVQCKNLCQRAKCACGMPVRSLRDLNGGVQSMRIPKISEYTLKWNFRHPQSLYVQKLESLKNSWYEF